MCIRDRCLLTLYLRAFRFQLALLMPDKTAASTESALDMLERAAPRAFARLFPLLLTDNGAEFSDCAAIERSALDPAAGRCSVYYCDVRQSQQKGGCERNHVEVRKILPKGRGISFDRLGGRDCAVLMSHLNSCLLYTSQRSKPSISTFTLRSAHISSVTSTGKP